MDIPRLVIAGTHSGVGKTTVMLGLLALFKKKGISCQPFKVGPDYIDPGLHTKASGHVSRNLDTFLLPEDTVLEIFLRSSCGKQLSLIEGVMGLFDGRLAENGKNHSTAEIAKLLRAPVLLVLDAKGMSQSAAAWVLGFSRLDRKLRVAGVFLNRVASARHLDSLKKSIEKKTGIPVLGWLFRDEALALPSQHLGLMPASERTPKKEWLSKLANKMEQSIRLGALLKCANSAPSPSFPREKIFNGQKSFRARIGLAWDSAFSFYYADALDYLGYLGVEWARFSPMTSTRLPKDIDGLYFGGGFPENHAEALAGNKSILQEIRKASERGMSIFAECGGLMLLGKEIVDFEGIRHRMAGALPLSVAMGKKLKLGYVEALALRNSSLALRGEKIRGHIFHYSDARPTSSAKQVFRLDRKDLGRDGFLFKNTLACYTHSNFCGSPKRAERFIHACERYHAEK